jgi:uncharacterized membrane protein
MKNYGLDGITKDLQSTITAFLAFATAVGLFTQSQSTQITEVSSSIFTILGGVTTIVGVLKALYKGKGETEGEPGKAASPAL